MASILYFKRMVSSGIRIRAPNCKTFAAGIQKHFPPLHQPQSREWLPSLHQLLRAIEPEMQGCMPLSNQAYSVEGDLLAYLYPRSVPYMLSLQRCKRGAESRTEPRR